MKINNTVEAITSPLELKEKLESIYIIDNYISHGQDSYINFVETIYDIVKGCIEHKDCREFMVQFKFRERDKNLHRLQLRHFLINLFVWYPFTLMADDLSEDWIFDAGKDITKVHDYINRTISLMMTRNVKNKAMNKAVSQVLDMLRSISLNFSEIMNLSITARTFTEAYNASDRMKEIFFAKFDQNEQPAIIEAKMASMLDEEKELFMSLKNNSIGIFLRTGEGIKPKQLQEATSNGGMKPDINGNTMPIVINGSQIVTGLSKPGYMYLDATGAHKSYIMNKKVMGNAGYYAKSLAILGTTIKLSDRVNDCHTHHLLRIDITDNDVLGKFNGKYYTLNPKKPEELSLLDSSKDKDLIGKTVWFRSPVYCCCRMRKGRRTICHKCFGSSAKLNLDIADGIGVYIIQTITNPIQQNVLSTKHLLTTRSELIKFTSDFEAIFQFYGGELSVRENVNVNLDDLVLEIPEKSLFHEDIFDGDSDTNTYILGEFYIKDIKTGDTSVINATDSKKIYVSKLLNELIDEYKGVVPISALAEEPCVMRIDIQNNELTKPLYQLMDLTSSQHLPETADDMVQRYVELLVNSNIETPSVGAEIITAALMRTVDDVTKFPDFTFDGHVDYTLVTLDRAIKGNKSMNTGLLFEYLKDQLLSPSADKRTGESIHDVMFSETVSTKPMQDFYKNGGGVD